MTWRGPDLTVDYQSVFVRGYGYDTFNDSVEEDDRGTKAVRSAIEDSTFDRATAQGQIGQFITQLGGREHPHDSNVALSSIGVTLANGVPAQYDAEYEAKRASGFSIEGVEEEIKWHRDVSGSDIPPNDEDEKGYRTRRITVLQIEFLHYYHQIAAPSISSSVGTINDAEYTLEASLPDGTSGTVLVAPAKTLFYEMPTYQQAIIGGTSIWEKRYRFAYRAETWFRTKRDKNDNVTTEDMFSTSTFPTVPFA